MTIPWLKENYDLDVIAVCANVTKMTIEQRRKQKQVVL
ncbi:MAG: hypothetical protein ACLTK8_03590 [Paeniclostridium sp.]